MVISNFIMSVTGAYSISCLFMFRALLLSDFNHIAVTDSPRTQSFAFPYFRKLTKLQEKILINQLSSLVSFLGTMVLVQNQIEVCTPLESNLIDILSFVGRTRDLSLPCQDDCCQLKMTENELSAPWLMNAEELNMIASVGFKLAAKFCCILLKSVW